MFLSEKTAKLLLSNQIVKSKNVYNVLYI